MSDSAIEILKTYQTGTDPKVLQPIRNEILATRDDSDAAHALEVRLVEILRSDVSIAAKDAVCRLLRSFGTAASVQALASLLGDERLSHMARYALERIPAPEAGQALRDALGKTSGRDRIGIITSLGVRAEGESVAPLRALLTEADAAITRSAALALGEVGNREAAEALMAASLTPAMRSSQADALLACSEKLAASGETSVVTKIRQKLAGGDFSDFVVTAAKRGMPPANK